MSAENVAMNTNEDAKTLLASQFSRLWTELVTKRLRVEENEAAGIIARTAERVGKIGDGAFCATWHGSCPAGLLDQHYRSVRRVL